METKVAVEKKVILLNGPPRSGKDLSAVIIRNFLTGQVMGYGKGLFKPEIIKFADPLKQAAHALLGIPYSCDYYEKEFGNEWKDKPQIEFYGKTPRETYISLSEEFAKPRFGESLFGRVAARRIQLDKQHNTFIIPDSGFSEEAAPLISLVGISNLLLIELDRPGTSFEGDSRGYVGDKLAAQFGNKLNRIKLPNSGDQAWLTMLLKGSVAKFFNIELNF